MRFSPENIIGKSSYPGKKSEELSEKKEKEEYAFNNTESASDYNKIKMVEAQNSVHPENMYNSVAEEEKIVSPDSSYTSPDNIVGKNEDDIISAIDERMTEERAKIEEVVELRDCGFFDIIDKLLKTVDKKGDNSEKENILNRLQSFIVEYKNILDSNLSVNEEEKKIEQAFNDNFGKIAYSSDGSAELVNEMMIVVKNAPKNRWRGEKVAASKDHQEYSNPQFNVKKKKNGFGRELLRKIKIKW